MTTKIKATNPYSGQSAMLTQDEYIVYTMVKKFEEMKEYELMQEGLSKFSKMNPKAYFTLLLRTAISITLSSQVDKKKMQLLTY